MAHLRTAVIGGSGFVGSRLVPSLRRGGHAVRVVDIRAPEWHEPDFVRADVRDAPAMVAALAGVDVVYNLAAEHRDDVRPASLYDEVNVEGARNVCAAADAHGIARQVFTSSVAVYGLASDNADETVAPAPFNDYGRTKALAETVYREWLAAGAGRSLAILRPTVVFGPGNRGNVYNLLRQLASCMFVMIGSGENRKSMAYVDNVAAALVFLLRGPDGGRIYNYVDKPDMTMNDLVAFVRREFGKNSPPLRLPQLAATAIGRSFDMASAVLNRPFPISRARVRKFTAETTFSAEAIRAAGFAPVVPLDEGLRRTLAGDFPVRPVAQRTASLRPPIG